MKLTRRSFLWVRGGSVAAGHCLAMNTLVPVTEVDNPLAAYPDPFLGEGLPTASS